MSNKEQIKDEIILTVKKAIGANSYYIKDYNFLIDSNDIDHIAEQTAEIIYNAGYRKTFTSAFASDTQKAYKEGYIKGIEERKAENERLTERLKQVLLSIDTVKEMNAMCNIDYHRKQAVKEFADKVKEYINNKVIADFDDSKSVKYYTVDLDEFESEIDELLKEYEQ